MASDDDDELAEIRAARAARIGGGASLTALREQQRRAQEEAARTSAYYVGDGRPKPAAAGSDDDEDGPVVVDAEEAGEGPSEDPDLRMDDETRAQFPMSFGEQEVKVAKPQEIYDKHKRPGFGPPRPPPRPVAGGGAGGQAGGSGFGPPRPPPKPSSGEATGTGNSGEDEVIPARPPGPQSGEGEDDGAGDVGPPRPPAGSEDADEAGGPSGDYDDEAQEGEEEDDPYMLPVTHEVALGSAQAKAVTCLDVDHSGSRLVTGSMDYTVRLYDFNGMKSDMRAFREMEPQEGHPVLSVSWSPSGDAILVVTGSSKAKIIDRNGLTRGEFVRGDMYIRDPKNTKGHVSGLTSGQWHPTDRHTAMTASEDGTVRMWDMENIAQKTVIKPTLAKPGRVSVTACSYGADGRLVGAGLMDGTIQIWSVAGKFGTSAAVGQVAAPKQQMIEKQAWSYVSRPSQLIHSAHAPTTEITSLAFSQDGHTLVSRGMDETLKLWDLRQFSKPVHVWGDLPCAYPTTKVLFSPDESLIVTGVSAGGNDDAGAVVFFDKGKRTLVRKVGMPGNVTALAWHHRLNQVFVGLGNRKAGGCRVLYDTTFSERGVMIGAARKPRMASPFDFTPPMVIKTPHALPMYKEERGGRKRKAKETLEASKARKPDPGMASGMGKQGRIGTTGGTLLTQHLLKQRGGLKAPEMTDPREALLRHEGKKDVFSNFTAAYAATQPERIFAPEEEDEEEAEERL